MLISLEPWPIHSRPDHSRPDDSWSDHSSRVFYRVWEASCTIQSQWGRPKGGPGAKKGLGECEISSYMLLMQGCGPPAAAASRCSTGVNARQLSRATWRQLLTIRQPPTQALAACRRVPAGQWWPLRPPLSGGPCRRPPPRRPAAAAPSQSSSCAHTATCVYVFVCLFVWVACVKERQLLEDAVISR